MFEIGDEMRKDLQELPELYRYTVTPGGGGGMGMGSGGTTLELDVLGYDLENSEIVAGQISEIMKNTEGLRDVKLSREDYMPQFQVMFDRNKLAMNGLNMTMAATVVRNRVNGVTASYFREDGEEYDIVVKNDAKFRTTVDDIKNILLYNSQGKAVRVIDKRKLI